MSGVRQAFTLIELLVVIAIIAILAAILFPVFAQAKVAAQKTKSLSNVKQTGTSTQIYMADHDDHMPDVFGHAPNGTTLYNYYNGFPAGWDNIIYEQQDSTCWGNSLQPYMKNMELFEAPSIGNTIMTAVFGSGAYANPRKTPGKTALVMNGLLSTYNHTAITDPARLVVFWYGYGKENLVGAINMNPALFCNEPGNGVCRFNPGGPPQPGSSCAGGGSCDIIWVPYTDSNDSVWFYGRGQNMGRADTSAKFYKLGGTPNVDKNSYDDPYRRYGRQGDYWLATHRCHTNGSHRYMSFFRPDSEFNYNFGFGVPCR